MTQQKKRKPQKTGRFLNILLLIFTFLVVFEGRLIINIASKGGIQNQVEEQLDEIFSSKDFQAQDQATNETEITPETSKEVIPKNITPFAENDPAYEKCIVQKQSALIDDSYFADAVFIGDSRVEGFRLQSGITQGDFLTGIGMDSANIFEKAYITTSAGNLTVFQALQNNSYKKMYIMLGTNELGYPDFEEFRKNYTKCLAELRKLMPDALFYVSAVPYVEEAKVQTGAYVNNNNINTVNQIILDICSANNYYYLNPNEVLSNGNGSLAQDATSDGIHMYPEYCAKWLDYLHDHYVTEDAAEPETDVSAETELSSETNE